MMVQLPIQVFHTRLDYFHGAYQECHFAGRSRCLLQQMSHIAAKKNETRQNENVSVLFFKIQKMFCSVMGPDIATITHFVECLLMGHQCFVLMWLEYKIANHWICGILFT